MSRTLNAIALFLIAISQAIAEEPEPTAESIRELFVTMQVNKIIDNVIEQTDANMEASLAQALVGQRLTGEQQKIIDEMRAKSVGLLKDELKWEKVEADFIGIYQRSFSQSEVDGLVQFYKSDVGKAVLAKMPRVMQQSMQFARTHLMTIMPKLEEIMRNTMAQLKASQQK